MTPANPQQMSGHKDDPDDLIAELTKLMAADVKSNSPEPAKPAAPIAEVRAPAPSIRIPGISQPVPATGFEAQPALAPEPQVNRPSQQPEGGSPSALSPSAQNAGKQEPPISNWRPAIAPNEVEARPSASVSSFDFDFGFNRERPEPAPKSAAPVARVVPRPVNPSPEESATPVPPALPAPEAAPPTPAYDPIAELIAAELSASVRQGIQPAAPAPRPAAAPVSLQPSSPAPATVPAQVAPVQVSPVQRPAQENDKFLTAPVFGLGNKPAGDSVTPKAQLDPMDEIESLIGEAVRVELSMPQAPHAVRSVEPVPRPSPSSPQIPAVPPLGGQFAPRRTTSLREAESTSGGAEEAILAAAAATGAEVGRVDLPFVDERSNGRNRKQTARDRDERQRRARSDREERASGGAFKQLVVPALAGTILVVGGFGLYWALGMGHHDGQAPVLTADTTPAKTIPPKPVDNATHSVVMDELGGAAPTPGKETLVSRDQTAGGDPAQVAPAITATAANANDGLANRKVRTVTVRPDGTIVSSDDSVAGAAKLPVDRPNVPAVPGVAVANADENAPLTTPSAPNAAAPDNGATAAASASAPEGTDAGASAAPMPGPLTTDMASADASAPTPLPRLTRSAVPSAASQQFASTQPHSPVNALVRTNNSSAAKPMDLIGNLAAASEGTPTPAPAGAANTAPSADAAPAAPSVAHVQLSSQPSAAGAQSSANTLQKRFGSLWGNAKLQIVKVDLSKGTYYRVVLPTSSLQSAQQMCSSIKSSGGDCVAANG